VKLWDAEQRFQSNRDLEARLAEVPTLAARAKNETLAELIKSDEGLLVCREEVSVGVERCRDAYNRYSKSHSTKARTPKRKPKVEHPSIQFKASDCVLGVGFIEVPIVGVLRSRIKDFDFGGLSGEFTAKAVVIQRIEEGRWDVSVSYEISKAQITKKGSGVIGIDINTSNTCAVYYLADDGTGEGMVFDLPDTSAADRDIRYYRRLLDEGNITYGSRRHRELLRLLERAKGRRANIIKEHHLVIVRFVVSLGAKHIFFEDMDLRDGFKDYHGWKKVAVNNLRRALTDRGRAADNGATVKTVNPAYTTMTCSSCGHIKEMAKQDRVYECPKCGLVMDRDLNSAKNIAVRGKTSMVGTTRR
jgi:putative transposase